MKHIIRILLAVVLLLVVPTSLNAQNPNGKTTKGKVTTNGKGTAKAKSTTTSKKEEADKRPFAIVKPLAEKGDVKAQHRLGDCYYYGYGITKDYKQAAYWYRKAAEQGYADAQIRLGACYNYGNGVIKNKEQSVYWYRKAAEQGDDGGQAMLGLSYYFGDGVEKDKNQAKYWLEKAAAQGNSEAKDLLDLDKVMRAPHPDLDSIIIACFAEYTKSSSSSSSTSSSGQSNNTVDQWPSFPGGQSALFQFLSQNLHYPEKCAENGIQGKVICSCVVDIDGSITDVQIKQSVDPSLDKEAIRVIKSMPKWIPGKMDGKPVRVRYSIPITFRL